MHRVCINLPIEDDITRPINKNIKYLCNECCRVEDKFDQLKNFLVQLVDQKCASLETALGNREHSVSAPDVQENIIAEATERLSRRNNIIIRNMADNNDAQSDAHVVTKILTEVLGANASVPLAVTRMGRHSITKPRLLKVKLNDQSQVISILRNKRKLLLNDQLKKISIQPDQTPQQQKYLELL